MNKFQKVSLQISKDDFKNHRELYLNSSIQKNSREWYCFIKKIKWNYLKALDFKKWNKRQI